MRVLLILGLTALCAGSVSAVELYSNGTIITDPAAGAGGFNASRAAADFDTLGFSVLSPARLADDFAATNAWVVQSVRVSGYIFGSYPVPPSASPISSATVSIWNGAPEAAGSTLLITSSNVVSNTFSQTYRVSNNLAALADASRPVFDLEVAFPETTLVPGTYWIDYSLSGAGNVFSPMVMTSGAGGPMTVIGNAQRKLSPTGTWVTLFGGTTEQGLDFPFRINGFIVPEPGSARAGFSGPGWPASPQPLALLFERPVLYQSRPAAVPIKR